MTTEQILNRISNNDWLLEIMERAFTEGGYEFSISNLINSANAQLDKVDAAWEELNQHYFDDDEECCDSSIWDLDSSMLPDYIDE